MDKMASDGLIQYKAPDQVDIEILLGFVSEIDDLDDDECYVIERLARALPPESVYDIRWFENKLDKQRRSAGQR